MPGEQNRRNEVRAPIELKVEYKRLNTFFYDYTRNISKGGTFIKTDKPLPVGTRFLFKLTVPRLEDPLVLQGEVRWTQRPGEPVRDASNADPGMGIRFIYGDDNQRVDVEQTVERMMVQSLGQLIYSQLCGEAKTSGGEGPGDGGGDDGDS